VAVSASRTIARGHHNPLIVQVRYRSLARPAVCNNPPVCWPKVKPHCMKRFARWTLLSLCLLGGPRCAFLSNPSASPPVASTSNPVSTSVTVPPMLDGQPTANNAATWPAYRDPGSTFAFRYPPACNVIQQDQGSLWVGRIELATLKAGGRSLAQNVNDLVDTKVRVNGWAIESQQPQRLGGEPAIQVEYRFGGTSRYGTAVLTQRSDRLYVWGWTAGGFTCNEPQVFGAIISTFQFLQ